MIFAAKPKNIYRCASYLTIRKEKQIMDFSTELCTLRGLTVSRGSPSLPSPLFKRFIDENES